MSDTVRNRDYLIAALADNNSGNITPQVMRDWLASIYLSADVDSAFLRLDGTVPMAGALNMSSNDINNVATITSSEVATSSIQMIESGPINLDESSEILGDGDGNIILTCNSMSINSSNADVSAFEIGHTAGVGDGWYSHLRFTNPSSTHDSRVTVAHDGMLFKNFDPDASNLFSFRDGDDNHIMDIQTGGAGVLFNYDVTLAYETNLVLGFLSNINYTTEITTESTYASGSIEFNNYPTDGDTLYFSNLGWSITFSAGTISDNIGSPTGSYIPTTSATSATGQIQFALSEGAPTINSGDTITIGANTITLTVAGSDVIASDGSNTIGSSLSSGGIVTAVSSVLGSEGFGCSIDNVNAIVYVTAQSSGSAGNITITTSDPSNITVAGLSGGSDGSTGSASNAASSLKSFMNGSGTWNGYFSISWDGDVTLTVTSNNPGSSGPGTNGSIYVIDGDGDDFSLTGMSGGVDGSTTLEPSPLYDSSTQTAYLDNIVMPYGTIEPGEGSITFIMGEGSFFVNVDGSVSSTTGFYGQTISNGGEGLTLGMYGENVTMNDGCSLYMNGNSLRTDGGAILFYSKAGNYVNEGVIATGTFGGEGSVGGVSRFCGYGWEDNWQNGVLTLQGPESGGGPNGDLTNGICFVSNNAAIVDASYNGNVTVYQNGNLCVGGPAVGGSGSMYLNYGDLYTASASFIPATFPQATIQFDGPIYQGTYPNVFFAVNGLTANFGDTTISDITDYSVSFTPYIPNTNATGQIQFSSPLEEGVFFDFGDGNSMTFSEGTATVSGPDVSGGSQTTGYAIGDMNSQAYAIGLLGSWITPLSFSRGETDGTWIITVTARSAGSSYNTTITSNSEVASVSGLSGGSTGQGSLADQVTALVNFLNGSSNYTTYFTITSGTDNPIALTSTNAGAAYNTVVEETGDAGSFIISSFNGGVDAHYSYSDEVLYDASTGNMNISSLSVNSIQVVGAQATAIPDATGAGDVVTTVNAILAAIRTHGLIASS